MILAQRKCLHRLQNFRSYDIIAYNNEQYGAENSDL